MRVQIIANASEAHQGKFIGKTAIVIDVIRTSSTIIAALEAGVAGIVPVETVMDAKDIYREGNVLGGERFCKKIAGFHYGNSPSEYREAAIQGKKLIMTTTNGTSAILRANKASNVLICSLSNVEACTKLALLCDQDIVILCAGSHDQFTIEDGLCAGIIIAYLQQFSPEEEMVQLDDLGYAMLALYRCHQNQITDTVARGLSGLRLQHLNLNKDIIDCTQLNTTTIVPAYYKGVIRALTSSEQSNISNPTH